MEQTEIEKLTDRVLLLERRSTVLEAMLEKARLVVEVHSESIQKLADIVAGATRPPSQPKSDLN